MPKEEIRKAYGDRLRVRVGAVIIDDVSARQSVLLVEHHGLYSDEPFWTLPGGEVEFGESLTEALAREVFEETRLKIREDGLLYTLDFVRPPLHAVSFYFRCQISGGELRAGSDPELPADEQLIRGAAFIPLARVGSLRVYPEGFAHTLVEDAIAGFSDHPRHLGTKR